MGRFNGDYLGTTAVGKGFAGQERRTSFAPRACDASLARVAFAGVAAEEVQTPAPSPEEALIAEHLHELPTQAEA